jgi:hypothetical protein
MIIAQSKVDQRRRAKKDVKKTFEEKISFQSKFVEERKDPGSC